MADNPSALACGLTSGELVGKECKYARSVRVGKVPVVVHIVDIPEICIYRDDAKSFCRRVSIRPVVCGSI